jgi:hypothetical protein
MNVEIRDTGMKTTKEGVEMHATLPCIKTYFMMFGSKQDVS